MIVPAASIDPPPDDKQTGRPSALWCLAALALVVVLAVPFVLVDVPPVLDYPNHLARLFVLAHPDDPALSQIYAPRWRILPNLGMDVLGAGLLQITSVHVGGRLLLALSLLAPVIGVIAYHRAAFGRFSLWPLASGVIAFNGIFQLGFMNFLLSMGLALIGSALWLALRRHGWWAAVAGASSVSVIFFAHLFGVILFALLIGGEEIAHWWRRWRAGLLTAREVLRSMALLAALGPAAVLFALSPLSEGPAEIGEWHGAQKIWALLTPVMTTSIVLTLVTGFAVFIVFVLLRREARWSPGALPGLAVLGIVFVLAPATIKNGTFVDVRLALMITLVLFAAMLPQIGRRTAMVVGLLFAALIAVRGGYIASTWIAHRADLADVRAALAPVQPLAKVLVVRGHPGNDTATPMPARALPGIYRLDGHLGALLAIERKAFWPNMFADPAQQPLEVRQPYRAIAQSPGEPIDLPLLQTDDAAAPGYIRNWRSSFDYVLLIDAPTPLPAINGLAVVKATPYAVLYRVERKR